MPPVEMNWPQRLNVRGFAGFQLGIILGSAWVFAAAGDAREWLKLLPPICAASIVVATLKHGLKFHLIVANSMLSVGSGSAIAISAGHVTSMMATGFTMAAVVVAFGIVLVAACNVCWLPNKLSNATLVLCLMVPSFLIGLESTPTQEHLYKTPSDEGLMNCVSIWSGAVVIMYAFLILTDGFRRTRSE